MTRDNAMSNDWWFSGDKTYKDVKWWVDNPPSFCHAIGVEAEYYRKGYYYALSCVCNELKFEDLESICDLKRE